MKYIKNCIAIGLTILTLTTSVFAKGLSGEASEEATSEEMRMENSQRTEMVTQAVTTYLKENDAYVAILARRGAGDPETGVSDTDDLDLSGMAHCGFVVRNGFGKDADYITMNLVRLPGAREEDGREFDLSELRVWSMPHFFIGTFEKDAIVFLPEKKLQLRLWNLLRANGRLKIEPVKELVRGADGKPVLDDQGKQREVTRQIISNGIFPLLHNPEYNLLSDYAENSSQNCNEHLLKTYIAVRDHWQADSKGYDPVAMDEDNLTELNRSVQKALEANFSPSRMILSRTKSTFAFVQNIRFGERYGKSPSLLGLKLAREKFDVVGVDSFLDPRNQSYLGWADYKVFREDQDADGNWTIEDWDRDYVKVNRFTGRKNQIALK